MSVYPLLILALVLIVAGVLLAARRRRNSAAPQDAFTKRPLVTANEQTMYWLLLATFPAPVCGAVPQPEKLLRDLSADKQQMTRPSAMERRRPGN